MSQKLETSQRQPLPAADGQHVDGPHFELNHNTTDESFDHSPCAGATLPQCVGTRLLRNGQQQTDEPEMDRSNVLVTVLMPCLNEARTLAACIQQAHAGCQAAIENRMFRSPGPASRRGTGEEEALSSPNPEQCSALELSYEILIADNGSTDGSPDIAIANGARVVHVAEKGYGAALRGGIAVARGKYIVIGDSDCSYGFSEVPRFLDKLEEGYDLVMGNRFAGSIEPGAMPWHHRYIGNPVLSGIGRLLYGTPCKDWHCGLRAFDREKVVELGLKSQGMEFASEMVVVASRRELQITETPTSLKPDGRERRPHLRSIRDGIRHLRLLISSYL